MVLNLLVFIRIDGTLVHFENVLESRAPSSFYAEAKIKIFVFGLVLKVFDSLGCKERSGVESGKRNDDEYRRSYLHTTLRHNHCVIQICSNRKEPDGGSSNPCVG